MATVSLALRGRGEVARDRAAHVRAIAEEMGYRPNPLLAALASKRFSNSKDLQGTPIAIFEFPALPGTPASRVSPYRTFLMEEARKLGYSPSHHLFPGKESPATLFHQLYSRSAQGLIVTGSVDMEEFGKAFDWRPFSVVQCARYRAEYPFHTVRPNIFQSIKQAFTTLRKRGYKRIGFALGRHEILLEDDEDRHGTAFALEQAYLPKKDRLPVYLGAIEDKKAFLHWFHAHRPDAVVGFRVGQYWYLRDEGIRIPEQVGFASLHLSEKDTEIAGFHQNAEEIARQSIQMLDQFIRNRQRGPATHPMHLLIPSRWQEGRTLHPELENGN